MVRRDRLEIIVDLLEVCMEEALKTNLVYKANLNFKIIREYLKILLEKEWIMKNGETYRITDKGKCFLAKAKNLLSEL